VLRPLDRPPGLEVIDESNHPVRGNPKTGTDSLLGLTLHDEKRAKKPEMLRVDSEWLEAVCEGPAHLESKSRHDERHARRWFWKPFRVGGGVTHGGILRT
jgi:hypothetical protein